MQSELVPTLRYISYLSSQTATPKDQNAIMIRPKINSQITWNEIKEKYRGLIWVGPSILVVHELSHIIIGKGLDIRYGWYGLSVQWEIPMAFFKSIGVYVNEFTPWMFAGGLVGSLLWIVLMRKHASHLGLHMTRQTFWAGLIYAFWISKWDLNWLAEEFLKVTVF